MSASKFVTFSRSSKAILAVVCIGLIIGLAFIVTALITIATNEPIKAAKLLLVFLGFGGLIFGSLYAGARWLTHGARSKVAHAESRAESIVIAVLFLVVVFFGFLILVAGLGCVSNLGFQAASSGLLVALAALSAGILIGFLFGIPRLVSGSGPEFDDQWGLKPASNTAKSRNRYESNTNLTQISDWLTKALVGVGLVEAHRLLALFQSTSLQIGNALGLQNPAIGSVVAGSTLAFFGTTGFLGGYMLTRLFLAGAFIRADLGTQLGEGRKAVRQLSLGIWEIGSKTPSYVKKSAEEIISTPLGEIYEWEDISTWAKAQLALGNIEQAIQGYEKALTIEQRDAGLRFDYAGALSQRDLNDSGEYLSVLKSARDCLQAADSVELRKNIFKALTFSTLYIEDGDHRPIPAGFGQTLRFGHEYVDDPGHLPSGGIYVNLACAYGQWAEWLILEKLPSIDEASLKRLWLNREQISMLPSESQEAAFEVYELATAIFGRSWRGEKITLLEIREHAIHWMRRAIDLDSGWKARLRDLISPSLSNQVPGSDHDLGVFLYDFEVRKLVGLPMVDSLTL